MNIEQLIIKYGFFRERRRMEEAEEAFRKIQALLAAQPEPAAWLEIHEGSEEVLDATLIKPDGGEAGIIYEPLYRKG